MGNALMGMGSGIVELLALSFAPSLELVIGKSPHRGLVGQKLWHQGGWRNLVIGRSCSDNEKVPRLLDPCITESCHF